MTFVDSLITLTMTVTAVTMTMTKNRNGQIQKRLQMKSVDAMQSRIERPEDQQLIIDTVELLVT